ncbi:hypothetical protein [Bradyrhizobium sp. 27S5]|uniref:hypothetical protein n=1 Tax=Bradyrhizobium sp. 27S5 TaxID=3139728 RepID=UPI0030D168F5
MEPTFDLLLKGLAIVSSSAAVIGSLFAFAGAMLALRAKRRAHEHLLSAYKDQLIALHLERRSAESLTKEEVERLSSMIEDSISSLSHSDKKLIEQGLHQRSPAAVRNYIRDLAAA